MKKICEDFKTKTGAQMSMESHKQGLPWKETWNEGKGKDKEIDFDLDIETYVDTDRLDSIRVAQEAVKAFDSQVALL